MSACFFKAQGRACVLERLHSSAHEDAAGFRFIDERWPNNLGNGPDGYPMNNVAWDDAGRKILADRAKDVTRAEEFRRKIRKELEEQ